eukprot:CAMPEP_0184316452 /NCGR_PEP_ID=MMETSP1049-20130417/90194_1 /TAXON_ID=77928 /ORGANISM="Proteomonas sulcata, Strain CCMP704" /LENGTH=176 /DNA_ID=CAMNT_0026635427 /DNA_START=173 /DNA_END=701 /DNA_ORIENTATION=-
MLLVESLECKTILKPLRLQIGQAEVVWAWKLPSNSHLAHAVLRRVVEGRGCCLGQLDSRWPCPVVQTQTSLPPGAQPQKILPLGQLTFALTCPQILNPTLPEFPAGPGRDSNLGFAFRIWANKEDGAGLTPFTQPTRTLEQIWHVPFLHHAVGRYLRRHPYTNFNMPESPDLKRVL